MAHPVYQGKDLPEHLTDVGDPVAIKIEIRIHASGAMSIVGPVEDQAWMLAALDHAKDAVKGYHIPRSQLIIPKQDVQLPHE